jgi:hypothetical protein
MLRYMPEMNEHWMNNEDLHLLLLRAEDGSSLSIAYRFGGHAETSRCSSGSTGLNPIWEA